MQRNAPEARKGDVFLENTEYITTWRWKEDEQGEMKWCSHYPAIDIVPFQEETFGRQ
jgi:hypothetical protein